MSKKQLWSLLISMAILLFTISPIMAQDVTAGELDLFGKPLGISAVIYQVATGGGFVPEEDGRFRLELSGVADETTVVQVSPPARVDYETSELAENWLAAAGLQQDSSTAAQASSLGIELPVQPMTVEAELSLPDYTILLRIYSADYDSAREVLIYYVEIDQIVPFEIGASINLADMSLEQLDSVISIGDKASPPSVFTSAVLTISGTDLFWKTLQDGADQRLRSIRVTEEPECVMARGRIANLETEALQLRTSKEDLYRSFETLLIDPEASQESLVSTSEALSDADSRLRENTAELALLRTWYGLNC